jgi:hypothetical protein
MLNLLLVIMIITIRSQHARRLISAAFIDSVNTARDLAWFSSRTLLLPWYMAKVGGMFEWRMLMALNGPKKRGYNRMLGLGRYLCHGSGWLDRQFANMYLRATNEPNARVAIAFMLLVEAFMVAGAAVVFPCSILMMIGLTSFALIAGLIGWFFADWLSPIER